VPFTWLFLGDIYWGLGTKKILDLTEKLRERTAESNIVDFADAEDVLSELLSLPPDYVMIIMNVDGELRYSVTRAERFIPEID